MTQLVVLGGGTAGWLTALLANKYYPDVPVTVIESDEIGILGAGEGTVPDFTEILSWLDIGFEDIIKHCDGSLKLGISFVNWRGDGQDYFHEFSNPEMPTQRWKSYCNLLGNNKSIKTIQGAFQLARQRKTPFTVDRHGNLVRHNPFALHFNARKLAAYLQKLANQRGVQRVEGKVIKVHDDDSGNITALELNDGVRVSGDFFFDCSGFARLLVGRHFGTEWISYREHLPMNTAMPFFVPHKNRDIIPQTEAIAMSSGWVWKIPVRDRYGCGYVFDNRYITEQQALEEIRDKFGQDLESPKTFRFEPGTFRDTLINNCLAVGLAQGFVEPLEATSIWVFCTIVQTFFKNNMLYDRDPQCVELYNTKCRERNAIVMEFLQHHYITDRKDTPFWREFRTTNKVLPSVATRIEFYKRHGIVGSGSLAGYPPYNQNIPEMFETLSWLQVSQGLGHFDAKPFQIMDKRIPEHNQYEQLTQEISTVVRQCVGHDRFIEFCCDQKK